MRPAQLAAALLPVLAATGTNGPVSEAAFALPTAAVAPLILPRAPALRATAVAPEQDPSAVEASLGLDRPTRRLIQQGLRNEGFDPGAPDGLFGPRTRTAIRDWQSSRGAAATGYLNGAEAELLQVAGAPPAAALETVAPAPSVPDAEVSTATALPPDESGVAAVIPQAVVDSPGLPAPADGNCRRWNTEYFFETATAELVTACLAAGADVAAQDDDGTTPLHWAVWMNEDPAVIEALLAAGADAGVTARGQRYSKPFGTPLHVAVRGGKHESREALYGRPDAMAWTDPAVIEALLAAGADVTAQDDAGDTPLSTAWRGLFRRILRTQPIEGFAAREALFKAFLASATDVMTARDANGITHLHYAAAVGSIEIVEALLAAGADVAARDGNRVTPLHAAAGFNANPAVVEALLAAGADVGALYDLDATPLHAAARYNENPAVVEALLAAGADVAARIDLFGVGHTPLHLAATYNENPAVVEALLTAGADVGALYDLDATPLHAAARYNENPAVVEALLAAGADVGARNRTDRTPLHLAAESNENPAVVEALLAAGADIAVRDSDDNTPLHAAARYNTNPAVVEALLAASADVAVRDSDDNTPLHAAARYNTNPAVVEALLAGGADTAAANARFAGAIGLTPLALAAILNGNPGVVEALLAAGADVAARNPLGVTPLHWAAAFNTPAVVEALLAAGANLAAREDDDGDTPLHVAARLNRNVAVIAALLDAGAHLEARNLRGRMPLHRAAESHGRAPAIKALVAAGANVEARDEDGNTPLHVAASYVGESVADGEREFRRHAGEAIEALLDAGANPTAPNGAGETPWDLARDNEALRGSDGYWRLNDARFDDPVQESRRPRSVRPGPFKEQFREHWIKRWSTSRS